MTWKSGSLGELADFFVWTPPPWFRQGACRNSNYKTWWWFKPKGSRFDKVIRERARAICIYECPVRWRCLQHYLDEPFGIFGGLDEEERRLVWLELSPQSRGRVDAVRAKVEKHSITKRGEVIVEIQVS